MKQKFPFISDCPYNLNYETRMNLVEITDKNGTPFLLMPEQIVKKKKISHRSIFVLLKNKASKILLVKKVSEFKKKLWEFPCYTTVYAGESAEGTAYNELKKHFFINEINLKEIATLPYLHDEVYVQASFFMAGPLYSFFEYNTDTIEDAMFLDKDELNGLLDFSPESFDPIITWANRANWLFK